jgi:hypothetical protein
MKGVAMEAYAYELTMEKRGVLTLTNLPFPAGEKVEVIIIPRSKPQPETPRYPFWGKPIRYLEPTAPIAEDDWEALS